MRIAEKVNAVTEIHVGLQHSDIRVISQNSHSTPQCASADDQDNRAAAVLGEHDIAKPTDSLIGPATIRERWSEKSVELTPPAATGWLSRKIAALVVRAEEALVGRDEDRNPVANLIFMVPCPRHQVSAVVPETLTGRRAPQEWQCGPQLRRDAPHAREVYRG